MNSIVIKNSHKAVDNLTSRGLSKEQAEQIIDTIQAAELVSDTATKADVLNLRSELYRALLIHGVLVVSSIISAGVVLGSIAG